MLFRTEATIALSDFLITYMFLFFTCAQLVLAIVGHYKDLVFEKKVLTRIGREDTKRDHPKLVKELNNRFQLLDNPDSDYTSSNQDDLENGEKKKSQKLNQNEVRKHTFYHAHPQVANQHYYNYEMPRPLRVTLYYLQSIMVFYTSGSMQNEGVVIAILGSILVAIGFKLAI